MEAGSAQIGLRWRATPWLVLALAVMGCAGPFTSGYLSGSRKQESELESQVAATDALAAATDPRSVALKKAMAQAPPTQEEALASVLHQLQEIRAIDPEAERKLMADLEEVKPEDYPMIVDFYASALAFRQQLAERQLAGDRQPQEPPAASPARLASSRGIGRDRPPLTRLDNSRADRIKSPHGADPSALPSVKLLPPAPSESPQDILPAQYEVDAVAADHPDATAHPRSVEAVATSPLRPIGEESHRSLAASNNLESREQSPPRRSMGRASATAAADWQGQLEATIAELEASVADSPSNVAELHEHMRLRTLQLLAGREEEAYRPIPGASPLQQDYWSKQLFAMAAYLDGAGKLDDKQRAAAAIAPLDEARAKLSELATLQVRNLTFVESVEGFGSYQPKKLASFRPGQKVTVYAEVENFTSESSEEGYHTSLGSSYQVLDQSGRRVDGKQFPDVQDRCRNRRRDFHMQYQFALPSRIYAGSYQLELTITDHHSGKIAQLTIPLEIVAP